MKKKSFTHQTLLPWIDRRWPLTIRTNPADTEKRLALPKSFITPCATETFLDFFYWDTVFASYGLLLSGHRDVVADCCDDMLALIDRLGFVPNAATPGAINRSQPPVFGFMVEALTAFDQSDDYALKALDRLDREYDFWMKKRLLGCGLNHYGHSATEKELRDLCTWCAPRIHREPPGDRQEQIALGAHLMAEAESGWDFTARFNHRALDYAPVDLNAILYANEVRLAGWHDLAGHAMQAQNYREAAARRARLMMELLFDPDQGCFFDYDAESGMRGELMTSAAYFPLWCGVPMAKDQIDRIFAVLRKTLWTPYGVMSTMRLPDDVQACQWDAPSMWPPQQIAALKALLRHGRKAEAEDLAERFSNCILNMANETGDLWEKYNGFDGKLCIANSEYGTPAMMGWTASCYIFCRSLLGDVNMK